GALTAAVLLRRGQEVLQVGVPVAAGGGGGEAIFSTQELLQPQRLLVRRTVLRRLLGQLQEPVRHLWRHLENGVVPLPRGRRGADPVAGVAYRDVGGDGVALPVAEPIRGGEHPRVGVEPGPYAADRPGDLRRRQPGTRKL